MVTNHLGPRFLGICMWNIDTCIVFQLQPPVLICCDKVRDLRDHSKSLAVVNREAIAYHCSCVHLETISQDRCNTPFFGSLLTFIKRIGWYFKETPGCSLLAAAVRNFDRDSGKLS